MKYFYIFALLFNLLFLTSFAQIGSGGLVGTVAAGFMDVVMNMVFAQCESNGLSEICTPEQIINAVNQVTDKIKAGNPDGGLPAPMVVISSLDAQNWICNTCNPCDEKATCVSGGCSATCECPNEKGWYGDGFIATPCYSTCGDGIIAGDEECDDFNNWSKDGCSAYCKWEPNPSHGRFTWNCSSGGSGPSTCTKVKVPRTPRVGIAGGRSRK
eukprot:GHVL01020630.1.p1 GENE.GHVL01020630.1~~GHVL01020630.1.p1  ORF type:complete len:248 (+),score=42.65 GHVL01020630.1:108-746(+)